MNHYKLYQRHPVSCEAQCILIQRELLWVLGAKGSRLAILEATALATLEAAAWSC